MTLREATRLCNESIVSFLQRSFPSPEPLRTKHARERARIQRAGGQLNQFMSEPAMTTLRKLT